MMLVEGWSADYQDGRAPHPVVLPHAWRQELPVTFEGPVLYKAVLDIPKEGGWLLFHGVSYACVVTVEEREILRHEGIWDTFSAPVHDWSGKVVQLTVEVVKNGGPTHPVTHVASGFLPYVFHTFGGVYKPVEFHPGPVDPLDYRAAAEPRISVDGSKLYLDGRPFYMRGLLHWGWFPEIGHTNPPIEEIRKEVREAKRLGFNTVKFCLWVPPHAYLDVLEEEGMVAWLELPVWNPARDETVHGRLAKELERIVRQYRHHPNIVAWTVGCELGGSVPASFRQRLTSIIHSLTNCPLVKDDSGGAEMYGGDPREYGTFYDFHPYCDLQFYPPVLDELLPGPRQEQPMLLGEFNDYDSHRDLSRLLEDHPYWASALPEFNDLGVRWQHDLPRVLLESRFAHEPRAACHHGLMRSANSKGAFIRQTVSDAVRSREPISGYVVTGWRDTPISSSGMFDDWGHARYERAATLAWNGPAALFLIPQRCPTWISGGNRPGYRDVGNVWIGQVLWKIGVHSEAPLTAGGLWRLSRESKVVAEGIVERYALDPLRPHEVGEIFVEIGEPGDYLLHVEFGSLRREWPIHAVSERKVTGKLVVDRAWKELTQDLFGIDIQALGDFDWLFHEPTVVVLNDWGTLPKPFWRECAYEYLETEFWDRTKLRDAWERLLPICGDRVLDLAALETRTSEPLTPLMRRIDTRTYAETVVLARVADASYVTTLRPFGGLGSQPPGLRHNPSGAQFLYDLLS